MREHSDDFPLPLALLILGLVLVFVFLSKPILSGELPWANVEGFLVRNQIVLIASSVLLIFNSSSLIGGLQRWIGFRKQGSRLKILRGQRSLFTRELLVRLLLGLIASISTFLILNHLNAGGLRWL